MVASPSYAGVKFNFSPPHFLLLLVHSVYSSISHRSWEWTFLCGGDTELYSGFRALNERNHIIIPLYHLYHVYDHAMGIKWLFYCTQLFRVLSVHFIDCDDSISIFETCSCLSGSAILVRHILGLFLRILFQQKCDG